MDAPSSQHKIVNPEPGKRNILITSALPYVNNVPHLGNLIGCVLSADVYSRYCRLRGYNSIFICGTDEYGTATETKALEEKTTPKALCDKYNAIHKEIYDWFGVDFDYFGRTTTPAQTEICQDIFLKLHKNGQLVEKTQQQQYCEKCERFLADRYVEGACPHCKTEGVNGDQCDKCGKLLEPTELLNPRCTICKHTPTIRETTHFYINLPEIEKKLDAWVDKSSKEGNWSANSISVTKAWIKGGLEPRCITRDLKWGVPVPWERLPKEQGERYKEKVFYVWFDAPIGYISITANYTKDWAQWWKNPDNVKLVQFMGKDNVPFHTVIWPSSLIGSGDNYTLLHHISTTDYLTYEGLKFSKRNKIGVFGNEAKDTGIPCDVWRYYLLSIRPETGDANFAWDDFQAKNNAELLGKFGNFINRALKFVETHFDSVVPQAGSLTNVDKEFIEKINATLQEYIKALEAVQLREGARLLMDLSQLANGYFQDQEPWSLFPKAKAEEPADEKSDKKKAPKKKVVAADPERCKTVIAVAVNVAYLLGVVAHPYTPNISKTIFHQLNTPLKLLPSEFTFEIKIGVPEPLFTKLEDAPIEALRKRFTPSTFKYDIRVGKVLAVNDHPKADRLYVINLDLGKEKRTVVAGLKEHYTKEQLNGKTVVALCNLKVTPFQGVQSEAMILVAAPASGPMQTLGVPEDVPLGTQILPKGFQLSLKSNLDFKKDFQKDRFLTNAAGRVEFVEVTENDGKPAENRVVLICKGLDSGPSAAVPPESVVR